MKKKLISKVTGISVSLCVGIAVVTACNGGGNSTSSGNPVPPKSLLDVTTYHNDNMRTGQNPNETVLTRANVNANTFGKIGALPVDGVVYAQPLYVKNVAVAGSGTHNLVLVATEHDSVYAFDATTLSTTPIWKRTFTGDSEYPCTNCMTLSYLDDQAPNIYPEIGITATPVIDMSTGIMYVIATSKENGDIYQKIHGLYIDSGKEIPGSPVIVHPSLPGNGAGSTPAGVIPFDPAAQLSRSALVLSNERVFAAFSSYDDREPAHGWLVEYNASNLSQVGAWMSTPHSGDGNIWMSGGGPAVDSNGYFYFATANGDPGEFSPLDYHDSFVKLMVANNGAISLTDFFQPYNSIPLMEGDVEFGSGGVMILPDQPGPHPHLMVGGGKQGTIYVMNRDNLGKSILTTNPSATSDTQIVEEIVGELPGGKAFGPGIYSTPAYFDGNVFYCGAGDFLRTFPVENGVLSVNGQKANEEIVRQGSTPSISSNGSQNGIVWILDASAYSYTFTFPVINVLSNGPAVLYAYNTDDLSTPLYSSARQTATDDAGFATKFAVPTVTDGKVFVGTQTEVSVYGLKSSVPSLPVSSGLKLHSLDSRSPASIEERRQTILKSQQIWDAPNPRDRDETSCGMVSTKKNQDF